jgi:energy-coupling factor transporter ATP-binding protein EcfA2
MGISMGEIQKVTISGFRGINTPPLELDFKKDNSIQSMMIYGRNGSGKSSIVDAWEWLYSGRIEHLAWEDAKEHVYPHKEAKDGQTWIEVEFTNEEIGKIRLEFDPSRITIAKIEGDLEKVKEFIPYPCHLRYRDLTEFVYERKGKKYEILSYQMGFGNALNIQNHLQTCAKLVEERLEELQKEINMFSKEYQKASGEEPKDVRSFIKTLNAIFNRQGITSINEVAEVKTGFEKLSERVEKDEKSKNLLLWNDIQGIVDGFYPVEDIHSNISKFQEDFIEFKQNEEEISKLVLLDLYEKGIQVIESFEISDRCPLCDQPYDGDLIENIKIKQSHLDELGKRRKELEKRRKELFSPIDGIIQKIEHTNSYLEEKELKPPIIQFKEDLKSVIFPLKNCKDTLEKKIENIDKEFDFLTKVDTKEFRSLLDSESKIKEEISRRVEDLEKDESRKALVVDFQQADRLKYNFLRWDQLNKKIERFEEIKGTYETIKADYVEATKKSVQESFNAISFDVAAYFRIIEKDSTVLGAPRIKLFPEKDKAVELEVVFGGEPISPAHKFLSESQLNSFGLSIFLASVKHFNPNFKFMILDDVINSFDGYKRPQVIDLLSEHFSDYQILLLTHDSIWLDRLQRSFPQWARKHFFGWDYAIGPKIRTGKNSYEQIEEFLSEDDPAGAGRTFGVYLEWVLQELCESLGASIKYNRRNEYTLSELFQAFKGRMQKKLKSNSSVVESISDFESDAGFRNFCSHWKEPEIPYTSPEIRGIVERWKDIEHKVECDKCHKFIRYEKVSGYEHISCPCRELNLKAVK